MSCVQTWKCQFEKPTIKAMIGELDPTVRGLYEDLRNSLLETLGVKPRLEWMGITWNWCETVAIEDGGLLSAVHLIPDPENPRVAIALSTVFFEKYPPSKLPKALHAGLGNATCVGHRSWCEWALSSNEAVDSIQQVIELAHQG